MSKKEEAPVYIVLLKNRYLLFFREKPKKKGSYLAGVKLFQTKASTSALEINSWANSIDKHPQIEEVEDWI